MLPQIPAYRNSNKRYSQDKASSSTYIFLAEIEEDKVNRYDY